MRSPPSSIGKEVGRRERGTILRLLVTWRNRVDRAHPDRAAALARGGGKEGKRSWDRKGERMQRWNAGMEAVGGENLWKNMGV